MMNKKKQVAIRLDEEFYKNVTSSDIKRYMNSIKRKEVDGKVIEIGDEIREARWSSLNAFFTFLFSKASSSLK